MLTVSRAIQKLTEVTSTLVDTQLLAVEDCLGRVLGQDISSSMDVPPASNSAMDGYTFCHADAVAMNFNLPLSQRIPAGAEPSPLARNSVARIFTGAEIPLGADTVAIQENCHEDNGQVTIDKEISFGKNIRKRGQDVLSGARVLPKGTVIRAQEMGLLSSIGLETVQVFEPLKIAILSTGDELVEPGLPLKVGQIYNSNRALMIGLVKSLGMIPVDLGTAADCPEATDERLRVGATKADIIICAGGVSVGEEDHVKNSVEKIGALDFWRVAIKPGKPMAFGSVLDTPFIGLPGNPSSVFVTFMILARPFLLACQGNISPYPKTLKAIAAFDKCGEAREVYLRASLTENGKHVDIFPNQSSGVLSSACWGDVFVRQCSEETIRKGELVDVLPYAYF